MTTQPLETDTWNIEDADIQGKSHWWGYVLHFNEAATKLLERIDEFADKLAKQLPAEVKPIGTMIRGYIKARNVVIKIEDKSGQGVKLVSPWIMPTLLVPLPDGHHVDDSQLRWSTTSSDWDGQGSPWSDEQKLQNVFSESGPTLAVFQNKLFCVARGAGDQALWWMTFDGDWSAYQPIGVYSVNAPALAAYQDRLHLVHEGAGSDQNLYWLTYDGNSWSQHQPIGHALTAAAPTLAEFQGRLHLVHRGSGSNEYLWWKTYDGHSWTDDQRIGQLRSAASPTLAEFQGRLHLIYRGKDKDTHLWWATYDGHSWTTDQMISQYVYSADGPALAVFEDKLYLAARGGGDQDIWWMAYDGNSWSPYKQIDNVYSAHKPGLANYRHPDGTRNQLLLVHRGSKT